MIWLPDAQNVIAIHEELVRLFEHEPDPISPPGVKSLALLESACNRPNTGAGSVEKYKTLAQKSATLFFALTKNHGFHNGNKRAALVALLTVLDRNDQRFAAGITDSDLYNLAVSVTADRFPAPNHKLSIDEVVSLIATWIKDHTESTTLKASGMRTFDFLARCQTAGARIKESGTSYVVSNGDRRISIGKDTRKIDGAVVKKWLKDLKLSEQSGVSLDDFREGAFIAREQLHRYMSALRRLAKT